MWTVHLDRRKASTGLGWDCCVGSIGGQIRGGSLPRAVGKLAGHQASLSTSLAPSITVVPLPPCERGLRTCRASSPGLM